MRRTVVVALAGIVVISGASVLLVDRLTSADTTLRPAPVEPARETQARQPPPPAAALVTPLLQPPDAPPAPPPDPASVEVAPEVGARLAAGAAQVDVGSQLAPLQARVTSRCGSMLLRSAADPADPTGGLTGEAVILLDLQSSAGQARVTGSKVLSQGAMRPSLTACAQHALRNQVFPASGPADQSLTIPVVLSMSGGSQ